MEKSLKQFLIYLGLTTDGKAKAKLRQVDRTASNLKAGDLYTFSYRLTTGKYKGNVQPYTIIAVAGSNDDTPVFVHSSTGNTLFRGYRVDHLSPETLTVILASIYHGREKLNGDFSYKQIEGFLGAVIGGDLSSENYRTFVDKARGTLTRIDLEGLKEAVDFMTEEEEQYG